MGPTQNTADFDSLVRTIVQVHKRLRDRAARAVNSCATLRNWLIGCHIHEYQQRGRDRATYGLRLIQTLAGYLRRHGMPNSDERELRRCRRFYLAYPQIREALTPEFAAAIPARHDTLIRGTVSPELSHSGTTLVQSLSFSQLTELMDIDDLLKRAFYESECIRGGWSVRELKRQIASLYYERSGLSQDKAKLARLADSKAEKVSARQLIRDPYVFEFLGLKPQEAMAESGLEGSLLDKLQEFLLELGRGFCFEARQKRIIIGGEHFFVDLVLYHRILKCHVLIELKVGGFSHEHLGQLNTYLNWYRAHEMAPDDGPPIGILLCTRKNQALVKYACAGMDNRLFVSKYQLGLPRKEEFRRFLEAQIRRD
jgi:predicted nuclease of restriction endonuclease-like (RecB) superfamily